MLVQKSTEVYTDLSGFAALTNLLTNGTNSIRPLVAEAEDGDSFITYSIRFDGYATKGVVKDFQVVVQSWAATYDKSIAIADQVFNAFNAGAGTYTNYISATPKFSEQQEIYTEQIFNIKK